jgi:hypothetical protein
VNSPVVFVAVGVITIFGVVAIGLAAFIADLGDFLDSAVRVSAEVHD